MIHDMSKETRFGSPGIKSIKAWFSANRAFYADFRQWLRDGGYSDSALNIYGVAARLALGLLDKPYWLIDLTIDLQYVRDYIATHYESESTRHGYHKGLAKLEQYLRYRCHRSTPEQPINWEHHIGPLPDWLADDVRAYIAHRRRTWLPEQQRRATIQLLSHSTQSLRWMANHARLTNIGDLTPDLWFDYVDVRLAAGIKPSTLNSELHNLQDFLRFLAEAGRSVCERMLRVKPLATGPKLPRDVPLDQLRCLLQEIETDAASSHAGIRRMGLMDRAWFLLMLHSGLRTGEIRFLRLSDLDLESQRVRIEQSKGLKDRIVCLSPATVDALHIYLEVRGPVATDHVFIYRHLPLSFRYCSQRLHTYGRRCGVRVSPHQLRHSCATLLLNAGAPILTVQTILGHKHIDTTLGYARLYDGTVAADYYHAMAKIESHLELVENADDLSLNGGQLLALVDALRVGTLNEDQRKMVQALRDGILNLLEQEVEMPTATEGSDDFPG